MTGFRKRNSRTAGNRAALDRVWPGMREWTRIIKANFGGVGGVEMKTLCQLMKKRRRDTQRETRLAQTRENVATAV